MLYLFQKEINNQHVLPKQIEEKAQVLRRTITSGKDNKECRLTYGVINDHTSIQLEKSQNGCNSSHKYIQKVQRITQLKMDSSVASICVPSTDTKTYQNNSLQHSIKQPSNQQHGLLNKRSWDQLPVYQNNQLQEQVEQKRVLTNPV